MSPYCIQIFDIMETTRAKENSVYEEEADKYIPGVCNIGKDEIKRRRTGMFLGLGLLIVVFILLEVFKVDKLWRLIIFLPAVSFAINFQQWYLKFCVRFGLKGVYNFKDVGNALTIEQKEYLRKDRMKATKMILTGVAFGLILTLAYYFLR
jgi:hypothetical protein